MESTVHLLVFRFSALGDIAMAVPVVRNLLHQHPNLKISFVSTPFVAPLFNNIERLNFLGVDFKTDYNGLSGIYRLSKKLKKEIAFDAIADLHNVLRTKLLRLFIGRKASVIDKGRAEKKELTRSVHKNLHPLKTGFQRYADVFEKLGYPIVLNVEDGKVKLIANTNLLPVQQPNAIWIGIAPFAKHTAKMYPLHKMKSVVDLLLVNPQVHIIVFGSAEEALLLEDWKNLDRVFLMAGKQKLAEDLNLISQLAIMISMDSANMHLASMLGVPVVSVWGGTHPWLGFYGWGQNMNNAIQTDLPCRPSSVFGNKECPVHGAAGCMQQITAEMIADKVKSLLCNTVN